LTTEGGFAAKHFAERKQLQHLACIEGRGSIADVVDGQASARR
jgi:hypothetical protein